MVRPHSFMTPLLTALLLLAPVLYLGSYFALVVPGGQPMDFNPEHGYYSRIGYYRVGGKETELLFSPLEKIDRRLRPERWNVGQVL
jgi:hypothetical protein